MSTYKDCKDFRAAMPDLLLEGTHEGSLDRRWAAHLAACAACSGEWAGLQATWTALDAWEAPEPSPYFDGRMQARMREAVAASPEGFLERMRSFFLFSTGRQFRPALAGALAVAMVVGGGSGLIGLQQHLAVQSDSATLNDLKVLDNNAQALQQMDQLLDENGDDTGVEPTT